jgi:hypothetical protein
MREESNTIWKRKLDWVAGHGGLALVTTHPDHMNFYGAPCGQEEYPAHHYIDFLRYIQQNYAGRYHHVLAEDLATDLMVRLS